MSLDYDSNLTKSKFVMKDKIFNSDPKMKINKLVKLINKAERPIIIAGQGTLDCFS